MKKIQVIDSPITAAPSSQQISQIIQWAGLRESRYVCVANVHMVMEAHWDQDFHRVLADADLACPDGMPIVWMLRNLGAPEQDRMAGLDILLAVCERCQLEGISIFLVGSTEDVLDRIRQRMKTDFSNLVIAGTISPPFRELTPAEETSLVEQINESGAGVVFVALGCPKQERWMAAHKGKISAVMIGLGGAFPVFAGTVKRAPALIRNLSLEWLFRLAQEPKRLWKRYWETNIPFIKLALTQLARDHGRDKNAS